MTFKNIRFIGVAASIGLVIPTAVPRLIAQGAPTVLVSPMGTPGQFTYTFVDPAAVDGGWVAMDFHRDPACAAISGFNLLRFVDFPNAFACPLTVSATEWWYVEDLAIAGGPWQSPPWSATFRTPRQAIWRGDGRVPIYFVEVAELLDAIRDGVLSVGELQLLPSLRVGYATHYEFIQLNSTRANSFPTLREGQTQTTAHGLLDDGRTFEFNRNTHGPNVTALKIVFQ